MHLIKSLVIGIMICAISFSFSGCASIIHGSTEQITFTSNPPGAKLQVAGQTTKTPAVLILERRGKHIAHYTMEGYEPCDVALKEGLSLWFLLGNLGFGGIPGWIIDSINGSTGDLSPDNVHVNMVSIAQAGPGETEVPVPPNEPVPPKPFQGTGFLLSESGYVVTNHHVVAGQAKIEVVFPHKNTTFNAEVQIKDTSNDLVILRLKGFAYNEIFAEEMPYALKPSGDVKLGEQVFTLGFPLGQVLGKSVKLSDGTISALSGIGDNASLFQISNPVQPGNSGGPLLDKDSNLIGVVFATLNAKLFLKYADTIPQNVNFAIKSDYLINLISMLPEGESILDRNGTLAGRALEEQVETMVPYVVTVYGK